MRSSFNVIISVDVAIHYSYIVGELFARIFLRYIPCIYIKFVFSYFTLFGDHYIWVKILSAVELVVVYFFYFFSSGSGSIVVYFFLQLYLKGFDPRQMVLFIYFNFSVPWYLGLVRELAMLYSQAQILD